MEKNNIQIALVNNTVFFKISGHAGTQQAEDLKKAFDNSKETHKNRVIIEMSKCSYIDSTFIGTLLMINKESSEKKGKTILLNIQPNVLKILKSMGLLPFLNIETSETFSNMNKLKTVPHYTDEKEILENMIKAHEAIISSSHENEHEFQNLIDFLKKQKD